MTSYPPPYAPGETKELLYPSVQDDPQPQQLVISQPAPVVVQSEQQQQVQAFAWHVAVSCCVLFCCCCPCGLLAFILASKTYSVRPIIYDQTFDWELAYKRLKRDIFVYTDNYRNSKSLHTSANVYIWPKISEIILSYLNYCVKQQNSTVLCIKETVRFRIKVSPLSL